MIHYRVIICSNINLDCKSWEIVYRFFMIKVATTIKLMIVNTYTDWNTRQENVFNRFQERSRSKLVGHAAQTISSSHLCYCTTPPADRWSLPDYYGCRVEIYDQRHVGMPVSLAIRINFTGWLMVVSETLFF